MVDSQDQDRSETKFGSVQPWVMALVALALATLAVLSASAMDSILSERPAPPPTMNTSADGGRALYDAHCASCHGIRGHVTYEWKKQNPDDTFPPPPHDSEGHTWHHSDEELVDIIENGGAAYEDAGFKSAMPAFRKVLTGAQIRSILGYIKSLWGPDELKAQKALE